MEQEKEELIWISALTGLIDSVNVSQLPRGEINIPQTEQSNRLSTLSHWLISFWWQLTPLRNSQPVVEN